MSLALTERVFRTIPIVLGVLATAGLVHFGTILAYPAKVDDDAYARVAAIAPVGVRTELPPDRRSRLPFLDAAMAAVVCRFDLGAGPFRISTPALARGFLSIAVYDRGGRAVSGLNLHDDSEDPTVVAVLTADQKTSVDATEPGGDDGRVLPVVAPGRLGFAIIEAPLDAADALAAVTCGTG